VRTSKQTIEYIKIRVSVTQPDIDGGVQCDPAKCMAKVAIARALHEHDPKGGGHKVRIDAGTVRCALNGHRWEAKTPRTARVNLIKYDAEGAVAVRPHRFTIKLVRGRKIEKLSEERKQQINDARAARIAAGRPDKHYTLRQRIVGFR